MQFPEFLTPNIFPPSIPLLGIIHWYGLMYILGFISVALVLQYYIKRKKFEIPLEDKGGLYDLIFFAIIGVIAGARLGFFLLYKQDAFLSWQGWLSIVGVEVAESGTRFVGFSGMSYHGGMLGVIVAIIIYCVRFKFRFWHIADWAAVPVPLALFFGRMGNFINAELYGHITKAKIGMHFPLYDRFGGYAEWHRLWKMLPADQQTAYLRAPDLEAVTNQAALDAGRTIAQSIDQMLVQDRMSAMKQFWMYVNPQGYAKIEPFYFYTQTRHPSQLYEAALEGLALFVILWLSTKLKLKQGVRFWVFIAGYGLFRSFCEFFRDPSTNASQYFGWLTSGMIYSFPMLAVGIAMIVVFSLRKEKPAVEAGAKR